PSISFANEPTPSPSPTPKPRMSKAQTLKKLSANETKLWDAWKNKDAKPFQMWLAADSVMVGEQGVAAKGDITKMMASMPCEIKSYSLSDWKIAMIDSNAAMMTSNGTVDETFACQAVSAVCVSEVFVKCGARLIALCR